MIFLTATDLKIEFVHLILLNSSDLLELYLLTFCACNTTHAIARQYFGEGFIPLPITCSKCGKVHKSYNDLLFDLNFEMKAIAS